jgi:hypothetical protein
MAMPSLMHDSSTSADTVAAISNVMHTIVSWVCDTALLSEVRALSMALTLRLPSLPCSMPNLSPYHHSVLVRAEHVVELAPCVRPLDVAERSFLAGLRVNALEYPARAVRLCVRRAGYRADHLVAPGHVVGR